MPLPIAIIASLSPAFDISFVSPQDILIIFPHIHTWDTQRNTSILFLDIFTTFTMPSFVETPVRTEIPGPVSKASTKRLDAIFDARAVHFVVDYDKSQDN